MQRCAAKPNAPAAAAGAGAAGKTVAL